ncbi:Magnesium transporter MRS2-2 [Ancistrocladus abbreviatus]
MGKNGCIAPAGEAELLAAVSSVKNKTAGGPQRQSWILFDSSGQSTILDVDKYAIIRRAHINARDLRILDPNLSYPPAILGRGKAIVLNLEEPCKGAVFSGLEMMAGQPYPILKFLNRLHKITKPKSSQIGGDPMANVSPFASLYTPLT